MKSTTLRQYGNIYRSKDETECGIFFTSNHKMWKKCDEERLDILQGTPLNNKH